MCNRRKLPGAIPYSRAPLVRKFPMFAELLVKFAFTSKLEHKKYALLIMEVSIKSQYVRVSVRDGQYTTYVTNTYKYLRFC